MPTISMDDAAERLAASVATAKPSDLVEYYLELFPELPSATPPVASELADYVRHGRFPEELVDLWNVVFPEDRNVRYDEEENMIHYNEELVGYED